MNTQDLNLTKIESFILKVEKQIEYYSFILNFLYDNPDSEINDAIKCWNFIEKAPEKKTYDSVYINVMKVYSDAVEYSKNQNEF